MNATPPWKKIVFFLLCLLSLTSLLFYPYNYSAYQYPKLLYSSLLLFLSLLFWAFYCLLGQGRRPNWEPLSLSFLVFILWTLIRYPWCSGSHPYLEGPLLWGSLGLTFFLTGQFAEEERKGRILAYLLACTAFIVSVYGLLQFLGIDLSLYRSAQSIFGPVRAEGRWGRPFSTLGNPNFLGELLAVLLPLVLSLCLSSASRALSIFWAGLTLGSAFLIWVSGSRGALLGAAGGIVFLFFLDRGKGHLRKSVFLVVAALVLLSSSLFMEGTRKGFFRTWQKVAAISSPAEGSAGARQLWWRISLEMIRAHPLWGTGTGTFREAYPIYQRRFFQDPASAPWVPKVAAAWRDNYNATVEAPHNEYLHIGAEMGAVGILLYSAFIWLLLKGSISRRAIPQPSWRNGCSAGCLAIFVASFFGFPLHLPSTGLIFAMMAGLLISCGGIPSEENERERKGDPLFGTLLVLLACLALLQLIHQGKVFASGRHLYQAIGHQLSRKVDRSLDELSEAKRLNPKDPEIDYWLGSTYLSLGRLDLAQDRLQRAKSSFNSPRLYLTLGSILSDLRRLPEAEALYREGIETYPGLAPLHSGLGAFYGRIQRYEEAIKELVKAREIDPSLPETYHLLGHAFYRLGQNREAHQSLQHFLSLAPSSDPRRHLDLSLMRSLKAGIKSP